MSVILVFIFCYFSYGFLFFVFLWVTWTYFIILFWLIYSVWNTSLHSTFSGLSSHYIVYSSCSIDIYNLPVQEKVRDHTFPLQSFALFHLNTVLNTSYKYTKTHTHLIDSDSSAKHNWDNLIRNYVHPHLYSVRSSFVSILNFFYFFVLETLSF